MLLVYRGWGGLGLGLPLLGALVGIAIAAGMDLDGRLFTVFAGIGALIGGVGAYLLGIQLNHTKPRRKVTEFEAERRAQLRQLVDADQFQAAPGVPAPSSREEGYEQADLLVSREASEIKKNTTNTHTLYGIPMQWFGVIGGVIGIVVLVAGVLTS